MITGGSVIDDDTMATATATSLATSESIKAYVDNYGQYNSLSRRQSSMATLMYHNVPLRLSQEQTMMMSIPRSHWNLIQ